MVDGKQSGTSPTTVPEPVDFGTAVPPVVLIRAAYRVGKGLTQDPEEHSTDGLGALSPHRVVRSGLSSLLSGAEVAVLWVVPGVTC